MQPSLHHFYHTLKEWEGLPRFVVCTCVISTPDVCLLFLCIRVGDKRVCAIQVRVRRVCCSLSTARCVWMEEREERAHSSKRHIDLSLAENSDSRIRMQHQRLNWRQTADYSRWRTGCYMLACVCDTDLEGLYIEIYSIIIPLSR